MYVNQGRKAKYALRPGTTYHLFVKLLNLSIDSVIKQKSKYILDDEYTDIPCFLWRCQHRIPAENGEKMAKIGKNWGKRSKNLEKWEN